MDLAIQNNNRQRRARGELGRNVAITEGLLMHRLAKWMLVCVFSLAIIFAPIACVGGYGPQQRAEQLRQNDEDLAAGRETQAQHDARAMQIMQTPNSSGSVDWGGIANTVLLIATGLIGGPLVTRWQRGPPTQTVGLPAEKVQGLGEVVAAAATGTKPA